MKWAKQGHIFVANNEQPWAQTHAMIPTPAWLDDDRLRLYVSFCDQKGRARVGHVDVEAENPQKILAVSSEPLLGIGRPGTFDENGVMQCSVVDAPGGKKYLYYVGFEVGTQIRYRMLTGLASKKADAEEFNRVSQTPILERSDAELYFRGGPFVLFDNGCFKMWYVAGSAWIELDEGIKPVYTINYLESNDGFHWGPSGRVCIDIENPDEYGFGRPYVIKDKDKYKMFYSIRKKGLGYRMGYAESTDGISWTRKDDEVGIDVSPEGWDSEMICYPAVCDVHGKRYMFYNGNQFGKTGFGYAILEQD